MTMKVMSLAELNASAIRLLCREFGVVNTARFINQFTTGYGNYTEEREQIIGNLTVDEIVTAIRQKRPTARRGKNSKIDG
ncbi:MAG: hypothetical protein U0350_18535 [Caldilineaceae bacterium]